jgi:hypothetical protein
MEIGTEILLKRIQDCPEEFAENDIHGLGRWARVLYAAKECLPKEEIDAIKKAMDESRRKHLLDKFNEQVLKTLAGENTDTGLENQAYLTTGSINRTFTGGVINNQSISNSQQFGHGWTDPRGMLSQGDFLSSAQHASQLMGQSQQEMAQQQYNAIQKAEKARNAAMQQSGSGLLGKLGFGRWF